MSHLTPIQYAVQRALKRVQEQDARWGFGRSYPSFEPTLQANADTPITGLAQYHGVVDPKRARLLTQAQDSMGDLSWMTILIEEVAKLTEHADNVPALIDHLADVAAVSLQWSAQLKWHHDKCADHAQGLGER